MKRVAALLLLTAVLGSLLLSGAPASAAAVTSVADFLRTDHGARISAYGGAGVTLGGDLFAMSANPASLGELDRFQAAFEHDALILDVAGNYAAFGGAYRDLFSYAVHYYGIDYGSTLRTTVNDPFGNSNSNFDGEDLSFGLGIGGRLGYRRDLSWGVAAKQFNMRIDRYKTQGHAFDAGIQWDIRRGDDERTGFRVGAALLNMGYSTAFRYTREALPFTWRVGGSYHGEIIGRKFETLVESVGGKGEETHYRVGAGIWPTSWLVLRAGANGERDFSRGFTAGFGVHWNNLSVDYAYVPYGELGARNKVSLQYAWGAPYVRPAPQRYTEVVEPPARVYASRPAPATSAAPVPQTAPPAVAPETPSSPVAPVATAPSAIERPIAPPATPTLEERIADYLRRGNDLVAQTRYHDAIQQYSRALDLDPRNAQAAYNLATTQLLVKDYRSAARSYERTTQLTPGDAEAWLYLGVCRFNLGESDAAIAAWQRTVELDPANEMARGYLDVLGI